MAVLKANGKPGQFEMTFVAKIVSAFLATLLAAAAIGSVSAALQLSSLSTKVESFSDNQVILRENVQIIRDRVSRIEGKQEKP